MVYGDMKSPIAQAFATLRRAGFTARLREPRENSGLQADALRDGITQPRKYVFLRGDSVMYGTILPQSGCEGDAKEAGDEVARALAAAGVKFEWDGNPTLAIVLKD